MFARRSQHVPKLGTIAVALILVIVGVLGTFGHLLPDVAGFTGELIGVWAFIVAAVVMLVGVFFEGI
jgi:hypothetical protein